MSILHGKDLVVSINGNAAMASKSCDLDVSAGTIEKSSPTSGKWKEFVADRNGWKLSTDHLVMAGTSFFVEGVNDPCTVNITNSKNDGGRIWATSQYASTDIMMGMTDGIYIYAMNALNGTIVNNRFFPYSSAEMITYLNGSTFTANNVVAIIMTRGGYIIGSNICTLLEEKFRIPMPVVSFGYYLTENDYQEYDAPMIMMGSRDTEVMPQGMIYNNDESNTLKVIFDSGVILSPNGMTGNVAMVGKECALRMKGEDGSLMAGTAICTQFRVTATKGSLMKGAFSWQGTGELQTNVYKMPQGDAEHTVNYITINMNKTNPLEIISGDVNGFVIKQIRQNTHRYMGRNTADGVMSICQLSDSNIVLYNDGAQSDQYQDGDVFVVHPTFYTETVEVADNVWRIGFALENRGTGWVEHPREEILGAYPGISTASYTGADTTDGAYLRSISLLETKYKTLVANGAKTHAENRGTGFSVTKMRHMNLYAMLFFAIYGRTDCRNICGAGVARNSCPTLDMFMTMDDSTPSSGITKGVSFMGLTDWWMPTFYELIGDATYYAGQGRLMIDTDEGSYRTCVLDVIASSVIPTKFLLGDYLDMIPAANQTNTDETKGFTSSALVDGSGPLFRGGDFPGLTSIRTDYNSALTPTGFARLSFTGTLVEYASSQEFLSLPIYVPTT